MQSAEPSGVGGQGCDAETGSVRIHVRRPSSSFAGLRLSLPRLHPASIAMIVTALIAALGYCATDVIRSMEEAEREIEMTASHVAAHLAGEDGSDMAATLGSIAAFALPGAVIHLLDSKDQVVRSLGETESEAKLAFADLQAERIWARSEIVGGFGSVVVTRKSAAAVMPALYRSGGLGGLVLMLCVASLIAGQRRARQAGVPDTASLLQLIETVPFGVACWSGEGKLSLCNDTYRHHAGLADRRAANYVEALHRLASTGDVKIITDEQTCRQIEIRHHNGKCLLIDERPLSNGGFITLLTDISEQRRLGALLDKAHEEHKLLVQRYHHEKLRAEAASRSKTSFLAHLSHDIRTPLNHIIGFADLIRHQTFGPLGDARYLNYVGDIKTSGEKLLANFAQILELAELDSGQKPLREEEVSVSELLESQLTRFGPNAERAGVKLGVANCANAVIRGDAYCLKRMLGNVVENAIRFTQAGGRVTLSAWLGTDGIVLEVTDTGIGIPEERLAELSQPFALGEAVFTRSHDGAGLGLAISRAIAQLSGGSLIIDSRQAIGTTVAISLPAPIHAERGESAAA